MCKESERRELLLKAVERQPHHEDEGDQRGCEGLSADGSTGDRMLGSGRPNQKVSQGHGGEGDQNQDRDLRIRGKW